MKGRACHPLATDERSLVSSIHRTRQRRKGDHTYMSAWQEFEATAVCFSHMFREIAQYGVPENGRSV